MIFSGSLSEGAREDSSLEKLKKVGLSARVRDI
jgi:hypothetical protein